MKVKITNGYVSEFQGELQLTTGKFGKLEVLETGEGFSDAGNMPETPVESAPAPAPEPVVEEKQAIQEEKIE